MRTREYKDRVQNAIDYSPPVRADAISKLLAMLKELGLLDPNSVDNTKTKKLITEYMASSALTSFERKNLLFALYEAQYQNTLPSNLDDELKNIFKTRGKGNQTPTPYDHYRKFFAPYSIATFQEISRDKLLQLCIVFQIPADKADKLLEALGFRRLYAANLFECCIWFILSKGGTVYELHKLYEKALERTKESSSNPVYEEEYQGPSRSQLPTQLFLDARKEFASENDFLEKYVEIVGHYFRYHSRAAAEEFAALLPIEKTDLFEYFSPIITDTRGSFQQQCLDIQEGSHLKDPSRECLLLMKFYRQMSDNSGKNKVNLRATYHSFRNIFKRCGFPGWNSNENNFDHLILELLSYSGDTLSQLEMTKRLISLYQFAQYAKIAPETQKLTEKNLLLAVTAFDSILQKEDSPTFVESCLKMGRGFQYEDANTGNPRGFCPSREYMILLRLLYYLVVECKLPQIQDINSFLSYFNFNPLNRNFFFDLYIQTILESEKIRPETKKNLLYPFYCFMLSFLDIKPKDSIERDDAFKKVFSFVSSGDISITNPIWKDSLVVVFNSIECIYGKVSIKKCKLLQYQMTIQHIFSYLEITIIHPADHEMDNRMISILEQDKYPARKITAGKLQNIEQYENLHYGTYEIVYRWTEHNTAKQLRFPISILTEEPSKKITITPDSTHNNQWIIDGCDKTPIVVKANNSTRLEIRVTIKEPERVSIKECSLSITDSEENQLTCSSVENFGETNTSWPFTFHDLPDGDLCIHFRWKSDTKEHKVSLPIQLDSTYKMYTFEIDRYEHTGKHFISIYEHAKSTSKGSITTRSKRQLILTQK